jgi:hypothetical protein
MERGSWPDGPGPPLPKSLGAEHTGIGGKNDHVVDQSGLTHCRRTALSAFFPPHHASLFRGLLGELKRQLGLESGHRLAVVNAPPECVLPMTHVVDAHRTDAVAGFARRQRDLPSLRTVYSAAHAGRPVWICYPMPGQPGADLQRHWLDRALRQYGVEGDEERAISGTWVALRLRPRQRGTDDELPPAAG